MGSDYQIQPGDTLSNIAKRFNTTVKQLKRLNNLKNSNLIFPGNTLKVPDLLSEDAFKIPGFTFDYQKKGATTNPPQKAPEIKHLYAFLPPQDKNEIKPLYAFLPPPDENNNKTKSQAPKKTK